MDSSLKTLTFIAVLAIGAGGALIGAQDAAASEKKLTQEAAKCGQSQDEQKGHGAAVEEEESAGGAAAKEDEGAHGTSLWGYNGKIGPTRWAKLSKDFRLCGNGETQSPIDISGFTGASVEPIEFDYHLTPLEIVHNGHTVQVNYQPGSGITVGGKRYELLQFHFHTPSEHSVAGQQASMEVHFVHKSADGELAVVGVLMEAGADNLALREPWAIMPKRAGPTTGP